MTFLGFLAPFWPPPAGKYIFLFKRVNFYALHGAGRLCVPDMYWEDGKTAVWRRAGYFPAGCAPVLPHFVFASSAAAVYNSRNA